VALRAQVLSDDAVRSKAMPILGVVVGLAAFRLISACTGACVRLMAAVAGRTCTGSSLVDEPQTGVTPRLT
jgi:hypothetical protein